MAGRDCPGSDDKPGPQDALAQERAVARPPSEEVDDSPDTAPLPRITRMPEGIEVVEERMGGAAGQWILEIRCECGRRWFELEEVETVRCPRCDMLVRVHIERPPAIRTR
jgi:hypothetical protein